MPTTAGAFITNIHLTDVIGLETFCEAYPSQSSTPSTPTPTKTPTKTPSSTTPTITNTGTVSIGNNGPGQDSGNTPTTTITVFNSVRSTALAPPMAPNELTTWLANMLTFVMSCFFLL